MKEIDNQSEDWSKLGAPTNSTRDLIKRISEINLIEIIGDLTRMSKRFDDTKENIEAYFRHSGNILPLTIREFVNWLAEKYPELRKTPVADIKFTREQFVEFSEDIKSQLEQMQQMRIDSHNNEKTADEPPPIQKLHPRYFIGDYFLLFEGLIENLNQKTQLADVSFYFRQMQKDGFVYPRIGESEFRDWLRDELSIDIESQLKTIDNCRTDSKLNHYKSTLYLHKQRSI